MQVQGAHPAERLVGDPQLAARERRAHAHAGRQWPVHGTRASPSTSAPAAAAPAAWCQAVVQIRAAPILCGKLCRTLIGFAVRAHDPRAPRKPMTSPCAAAGSSAVAVVVRSAQGRPRRWPNHVVVRLGGLAVHVGARRRPGSSSAALRQPLTSAKTPRMATQPKTKTKMAATSGHEPRRARETGGRPGLTELPDHDAARVGDPVDAGDGLQVRLEHGDRLVGQPGGAGRRREPGWSPR